MTKFLLAIQYGKQVPQMSALVHAKVQDETLCLLSALILYFFEIRK